MKLFEKMLYAVLASVVLLLSGCGPMQTQQTDANGQIVAAPAEVQKERGTVKVTLQTMKNEDGSPFCRLSFETKEVNFMGRPCAEVPGAEINSLIEANQPTVIRVVQKSAAAPAPVATATTPSLGWSFSRVTLDVVGAVIGGWAGNKLGGKIGGKDGRNIGTAIGAVLGAGVADEMQRPTTGVYSSGAPGYAPAPYHAPYYGASGYDRAALELEAQAASYRVQGRNASFNNCFQVYGYGCR